MNLVSPEEQTALLSHHERQVDEPVVETWSEELATGQDHHLLDQVEGAAA